MRPIKFRAWDKNDKVMLDWLAMTQTVWNINSNNPLLYRLLTNQNDGHILMQFTSFKDSDGKEIYEGDIISFYLESKGVYSIPFTELVTFGNGSFKALYPLWECRRMKVLGNKFQHPELLNQQP